MRTILSLFVLGTVLLSGMAWCQRPQEDTPAVVRILDDRTLWGEDFYRLLASLPDFQKAGEQRVVIFADRVVGANRYERMEEAERRARTLERELRSADQPLANAMRRRYQVQQPLALQPDAIQFLDDKSFRIAALAPNAQFLPQRLEVATVLERIGKPEKVTTELLDDGTERRPVILKIYHYAGGAIAFAESNIAARPGRVNRVFVDVQALTSALLEEEVSP